MFKTLQKLANSMDVDGHYALADQVDVILRSYAQQGNEWDEGEGEYYDAPRYDDTPRPTAEELERETGLLTHRTREQQADELRSTVKVLDTVIRYLKDPLTYNKISEANGVFGDEDRSLNELYRAAYKYIQLPNHIIVDPDILRKRDKIVSTMFNHASMLRQRSPIVPRK